MSEKLKITIYRGANQIGGCATEICYGEERILIISIQVIYRTAVYAGGLFDL